MAGAAGLAADELVLADWLELEMLADRASVVGRIVHRSIFISAGRHHLMHAVEHGPEQQELLIGVSLSFE